MQNKQQANPDVVRFVNGVWVIVDKSSVALYGRHYGPFNTEKVALEALRGGK